MKKLIAYECKKNFFRRSIFIIVALCSIINILKISSVYRENSLLGESTPSSWNEVYLFFYSEFCGPITLEKINSLLEIQKPLEKETADLTASTAMNNPNTYTGNIYSDYYLLTWCFVEPMEYAYMYQYMAQEVVYSARENMEFYKSYENEYLYKQNKIFASIFEGRQISSFEYTEMYKYYFEYDFSSLLILLICIYGLVGVFIIEKETDMEVLLLTTISGELKTVWAKIISSIFFVVGICIWFCIVDFLSFSFFFHSLEAAFVPVYALTNFEYSPLNINLIQYTFLSFGVKTLGMIILGLIVLLISSKAKKSLFPFVGSLVACGILLFLQEFFSKSQFLLGKIINPFSLVLNSEIFKKVEFVNLLGEPIFSYIVSIFFSLLLGVVLSAAIVLLSKRNTFTMRRQVEE